MTSASSVNTWWLVTDFNDCLTRFMSDFYNPFIIGLDGGLNFNSGFPNLTWMCMNNNEHFLVLLSSVFHISYSVVL